MADESDFFDQQLEEQQRLHAVIEALIERSEALAAALPPPQGVTGAIVEALAVDVNPTAYLPSE